MHDWHPDIAKLQAYDDDEWSRVHERFAGRLHAYVCKRIPDVQAREDVLQETLLGAVRGIAGFDPVYTFEQYLFGICHNRTIDQLRRARPQTFDQDTEDLPRFGELVADEETPSQVVHEADVAQLARALLSKILKAWVQETWELAEFDRLMVIEALIAGGWRNKDTWERFRLRDETAVAGIKFRALRRWNELARAGDPASELSSSLRSSAGSGGLPFDLDVGALWRDVRASCPARHWWARWLRENLDAGPRSYLDFHLEEMHCAWCAANLEDLRRKYAEADRPAVLERMHASTIAYLRSRTVQSAAG